MEYKKQIAIVLPVYCEELGLKNCINLIYSIIEGIKEFQWSIVVVNDGSTDSTYEVLLSMAKENDNLRIINLARNFGKEVALTAGINACQDFDAVITMDADLQHPPGMIVEFLKFWSSGSYDLVIGLRKANKDNGVIREFISMLYYKVLSKISSIEIRPGSTDFRLIDGDLVRQFAKFTERNRMVRGLLDWLGYRRIYVAFEAPSRTHGVSTFKISHLFKLAIDSIRAFSLLPLRLAGYFGAFICLISGSLLFWMLLNYLILSNQTYSPLAIFVVFNTFLVGLILIAIGIIGLYIENIHVEVTNRPLYVIKNIIN